MGYDRHHTIVVTSWSDKIVGAHEVAVREFDGIAPVTPLTQPVTNGYRSFMIAPDGSKEGWPPSDDGNAARARYLDFLRGQAYDDGSSVLSWVEVDFGGDDDEMIEVVGSAARVRCWEDHLGAWHAEASSAQTSRNEVE